MGGIIHKPMFHLIPSHNFVYSLQIQSLHLQLSDADFFAFSANSMALKMTSTRMSIAA